MKPGVEACILYPGMSKLYKQYNHVYVAFDVYFVTFLPSAPCKPLTPGAVATRSGTACHFLYKTSFCPVSLPGRGDITYV